MPDLPSTADIRQFLFEFFSDEELETLCFDYFPVVHSNLTTGLTKAQKIQSLLEYCRQYKMFPNLLAAIQKARPEQYEEQFRQAAKPESYLEPSKPVRDPRQTFICHAHEDAEFAHRLANDLKQNGWRVWIAPDSIRPGEMWGEGIDRGLAESGVLALILTPRSVQSSWVRKETYVAIQLESQGHIKFIPLEVEPCDVPGLWSTYQRISFRGDYGRGLTELLDVLEPERRLQPDRETREGVAQLDALKAQVARQERERQARETARMGTAPSVPASRQPWRARLALPAWMLPAAGSVLLIAVAVIACLVGSMIANNAANAAATQTAIAAALRPAKTATPTLTPTVSKTPAATSTPTLGPGATRIPEKDGMVMVYVPAGEFLMGSADSDKDAFDSEKPQHKVYLDAFWIDYTEVTNAQYKQCVQAQKCKASYFANDSNFNSDNQPVVGVDWYDAKNYCELFGRQLPTEAQWEKAARGTDGHLYPWGNDPVAGNRLNFCDKNCPGDAKDNTVDDGFAYTAPVGTYNAGASPYGARDMAGNVWEWVADWYDEKYYSNSPSNNPTGPTSRQYHALRGGSWYNSFLAARSAFRTWGGADPSSLVGFRCSR